MALAQPWHSLGPGTALALARPWPGHGVASVIFCNDFAYTRSDAKAAHDEVLKVLARVADDEIMSREEKQTGQHNAQLLQQLQAHTSTRAHACKQVCACTRACSCICSG